MKIKTLAIGFVAVVVLLAAAAGILMSRADSWRPQIEADLQTKLHRPVNLGHLSLGLFPPQIHIQGFTVGESAAFSQGRPFAQASDVFVSVGFFSLLRGDPEVKNLRLDKPQIELIRNSEGAWNFSSLTRSNPTEGGSAFSFDLLNIQNGQIGFTDELNHQPRAVYDHIDLKLSEFGPGKAFGVNLGIHFPGTGRQMVEFMGQIGPIDSTSENATPPVNGHLSIEQVSLAGVNQAVYGAIPPDTNSTLSGDAEIHTMADVIGCKGNLDFENTVINGAKLGFPIRASYNLEDDVKQKKLMIHPGIVQLGSTPFNASGEVSAAKTPAILNLNVKSENASLTELAQLAGGLGLAFSPAYQMNGKVNVDVTAQGPANALQLTGSVRAQNISASGGEIKQPVSIPEIDLTLTPDSILSNTFSATSGSTTLTIAFTLQQYATPNRSVDATIKTDGAKIGELLNIAKTYGVDAAEGVSGDGSLNLDVHIKGPLANAPALTYAGSAAVSNASLSTPQLKKPLGIATANAIFSQNSVALSNLAATLGETTVSGNLSVKEFAAPELNFDLHANKIDVDELQEMVAAPAPTKPGAQHKSPSLLLSTTGSGALSADLIKASDIVLKNVKTKCNLKKGEIEMSSLTADVFEGKADGSITADLRPAKPLCGVRMNFANVDANRLLSTVSSVKDTVYGNLAAKTNLHFTAAPGDLLTRSLNGTLSFNLTKGVLKNVNLMNEVNKVGKLLNRGGSEAPGGGTPLKKFQGDLNIVNGVASTQNLTGELNEGTIGARGTLNLINEEVNMHMTASLAGGGNQGGGLMDTVFSTAKGLFVIPVLVSGNMAHPKVEPDAEGMAKLKTTNAGKGAASGLLNGILGQGNSDGKTKKPANPVGSLLDQLKKH